MATTSVLRACVKGMEPGRKTHLLVRIHLRRHEPKRVVEIGDVQEHAAILRAASHHAVRDAELIGFATPPASTGGAVDQMMEWLPATGVLGKVDEFMSLQVVVRAFGQDIGPIRQ